MEEPKEEKVEVEPEPKVVDRIRIERGKVTDEQLEEIEEGEFHTIKEVANKLGYSATWIIDLCQKGRIQAIKPIGGRWRIPKSEYQRIITKGLPPLPKEKVKPPARVEEVEVDANKVLPAEDKDGKEKKKSWFSEILDFDLFR